eukprot:TRINITY_DN10501_c0_g4_i2.p1 TRINITY_DN10501_c0_g4~~TRINITY_DN10501_c0_g4_i2.p1  ORF type:complete len:205 (-),score=25.51 TRINITY_DN10501_c0_g4_i2:293-907(-)
MAPRMQNASIWLAQTYCPCPEKYITPGFDSSSTATSDADDHGDDSDTKVPSPSMIQPPEHLPSTRWWPADSVVQAKPSKWSAHDTTVIIQNLSRALSPAALRAEVDTSGFAGLYDIFYMPVCVNTKQNKGYAFVNFDSAEIAERFASMWDGTSPSEIVQSGWRQQRLAVSAAEVQGSRANNARLAQKKAFRIKDPALKPFVRSK